MCVCVCGIYLIDNDGSFIYKVHENGVDVGVGIGVSVGVGVGCSECFGVWIIEFGILLFLDIVQRLMYLYQSIMELFWGIVIILNV